MDTRRFSSRRVPKARWCAAVCWAHGLRSDCGSTVLHSKIALYYATLAGCRAGHSRRPRSNRHKQQQGCLQQASTTTTATTDDDYGDFGNSPGALKHFTDDRHLHSDCARGNISSSPSVRLLIFCCESRQSNIKSIVRSM
ncbi:hypothetical protein ZHAS_00005965 [Anopheles sinensis]|uniref:Uncharacterized protein n=1 Tax=Anopheles sinensis TaxID=74873 RepID=A0A084VKT9_ANOSI|nr:hypothetical protein ZHAS_00005965 [Anopheles sinensis]